jgi:hypothetical protein
MEGNTAVKRRSVQLQTEAGGQAGRKHGVIVECCAKMGHKICRP